MKKIFLILSMLICFQACHAVGVDCWEEVDMTFNPNTKSKMTDVLKGTTITRVKTEVDMVTPMTSVTVNENLYVFALPSGFSQVRIPISSYLYYNYNGSTPYYLEGFRYDSTEKNEFSADGGLRLGGVLGIENWYTMRAKSLSGAVSSLTFYDNKMGNIYAPINHSIASGLSYLEPYESKIGKIYQSATFHYIHTYCIVNTNSGSGGGGGTAGAAVNYIIKAN